MEGHLHQHVAQLLAHHGCVVGINGLQRLAGLLQKILPDGCVGLHLIPGAAVFSVTQNADDLQQILRRVAFPFGPVLHGCTPLSSAQKPELDCTAESAIFQGDKRIFRLFISIVSRIFTLCPVSVQKGRHPPTGTPPFQGFCVTAVRRTCCRTAHPQRPARRTGGRSFCPCQAFCPFPRSAQR